MRRILTAAAIALALNASADVFAQKRVWSYTAEELYERAKLFRLATEGKLSRTTPDIVGDAIKAGEFKGYVASSVDEANDDPDVAKCAKSLSLNELVYRVAVIITSDPLDRSRNAAVMIVVALHFVCENPITREPTFRKPSK